MSINRNILDTSDIDILISSSDSDSEEMDLSLNRKRERNDDPVEGHSSSMITNTSLLPDLSDNPPRRSRLSGISSPQNSPPPDTLEQEMAQVRQHAALQNIQLEASTPIDSTMGAVDLSTVSNEIRLEASLDGVRLLTRQAVGLPENSPQPGHLTWDNSDLNMSQNMALISPRPTPNIIDVDTNNPPIQTSEAISVSMLASLSECVKLQLNAAFDKINDSLIASIEESAKGAEKNKSDIEDMGIRIDSIEAQTVVTEDVTNTLGERINAVENENAYHRSLTDEHEGHIDRIDSTLSSLVRQSALLPLLNRIAALEAQAQNRNVNANTEPQLSDEELKRYRRQERNASDMYFILTIKFKGFAPPAAINNPRRQARNLLGLIDGEDIISTVKNVTFAADRASFRLTFHDMEGFYLAMSHLRTSCASIRRNGQTPALIFSQLTPPRFQASRERLQKRGLDLKNEKKIASFTFAVSMDQLIMKTSSRGSGPKTYKDDANQQESSADQPMDVDVDAAGYRCPVCLGPYNNTNPIMLYNCGHNIHESCLRTALGRSTQCPICRQSPDSLRIDCTSCLNTIASDDPTESSVIVVARKCGHFHLRGCQQDYLAGLTQHFPYSNEALEVLTSSNLPGCMSCVDTEPIPPNYLDTIMSPVQYIRGMADYADMNHLPLIPAPPARVPTPSPASGANSIPIGGARPRFPRRNRSPRNRTSRLQTTSPPARNRGANGDSREQRHDLRDRRTRSRSQGERIQ